MGYLANLIVNLKSLELRFQFPLWDTKNVGRTIIFTEVNFQFPLWDTSLSFSTKVFFSFPFNSLYGIPIYNNNLIKCELCFFQFPLWDTFYFKNINRPIKI